MAPSSLLALGQNRLRHSGPEWVETALNAKVTGTKPLQVQFATACFLTFIHMSEYPTGLAIDSLLAAVHNAGMRIAIVDESASRAAVIHEGLAVLDDCEIFVVNERKGLVTRIGQIAPDIVLIDLGNPSRDMLEEYFAVSRALARPIAMFVDDSDEEAIAASIDAGVSSYVVDGLAPHRIRPIIDLAVRRFNAFSRLQSELAEAQGKLAERDTIDRAKRILMDSRGMTEPQAYAELRKTAMNQGRRISEIAEAVITAHKLLGGQ